jgi:dienelactone hydrolase
MAIADVTTAATFGTCIYPKLLPDLALRCEAQGLPTQVFYSVWIRRGLFAAFCLAFAIPARAADPAVANACRADAIKFCSTVIRDETKRQTCMAAHGAELSMRCITALHDSRGTAAGEAIVVPIGQGAKAVQLKGWLVRPKARDRFGVVIILHRCDGLNLPGWNQALRWARWFNEQGFGAFILDGFTGRGLISVCGKQTTSLPSEQLQDLPATAARLAKVPGVDTDKIVAFGISYGGWNVVEYAYQPLTPGLIRPHALIALYPFCAVHEERKIGTPLLVLAGGDDDWMPSERCPALASLGAPGEAAPRVKIYAGARHLFDVQQAPLTYLGHRLEYNKAADEDAHAQILEFLKTTVGKVN